MHISPVLKRLAISGAVLFLLAAAANAAVDPNVYLAMGDGITYGSVYDFTPWPPRLDTLLGSGKTVVNRGKSASRVGYGSSKVNSYLAQYQPGYLLVLYGSNDLGVGNSIDYIIGELRYMIRAAKANSTVPVVGTLPPIFTGASGQSTLNSRIRSLASQEGIQCADVSAAFNGRRSLIMDDGLHPTSEGQQLIARTFHAAIQASPPPISLSLSPSSAQIQDVGTGGQSFAVSATTAWTATDNQAWIAITAGAAGTGNGTVTYRVEANTGPAARSGAITVAASGVSRTFTVNQAAASLAVSPAGFALPATGAAGRQIAVAAHLPWTATSSHPAWLQIVSGFSGTGNGTTTFNVPANGGGARAGSLAFSVGGLSRTATVVQWPQPTWGDAAPADFDGTGSAELAVFQPSTGKWSVAFDTGVQWLFPFGWSAVVPVPADYDGDGLLDFGVYHPATGNWHVLQSFDGQTHSDAFGWIESIPLPGDYDGDGVADLAVFHRPTAQWYFRYSSGGPDASVAFGWSAVIPVPADYDGDGAVDLAVYHPATGDWYVHESSTGNVVARQLGGSQALPVPADYDGDGKADVAVFTRATAQWQVTYSGGGSLALAFGWSAVLPVPADYDGDGQADVAVYHPAGGNWYVRQSSDETTVATPNGGPGQNPVLLNSLIHSWFRLP